VAATPHPRGTCSLLALTCQTTRRGHHPSPRGIGSRLAFMRLHTCYPAPVPENYAHSQARLHTAMPPS
jgi:hypothetical protein